MIEGINYYPKKRKNKSKLIYWTLSPIVIFAIAYWYFDTGQTLETSAPTTIIISEPQIETNTKISVEPAKIKKKTPEILENLDEVLQNQTIKKNQ